MKNMVKPFGFTALVAVIVLSMTGCPNEPEPEPTHVHQWGAYAQTTPPTCTAKGVETRVCALDPAHKETRTGADINPDAHVWSGWNVTTPATCITKGSGTRTCTANPVHDADTGTDNIPIDPNAHDWETTTTAATETTNGKDDSICQHDHSHTETRTLYATGTAGLDFALIGSGANVGTYRVSKGTFSGATVHIPAYHRPDANSAYLPVTEISNGTDAVNNNAFGGSGSDTNVTLTAVTFAAESQLKSISNYAFTFCHGLTSITIPASITSIGNYAFGYSSNLTSVIFAANSQLTSIGESAFNNCKFTNITIPTSVMSIGVGAFANCTGLTSITILAGEMSIGNYAFSNCTSLTSITIPTGVTSIGDYAFQGCSGLTSITIDVGVTSIGNWAFSRCANLTSITIPAGVTSIGSYAFWECTSLASIDIPASVTSIGNNAFSSSGPTSINVDPNNPNYTSEDGILYNKAKTTIIAYPAASGNVTIGAGVTSIVSYAFYNCLNLTSITIPNSVTSIGYWAFSGWTASQTINVRGYASESAADAAWGAGWRNECDAIRKYWNGSSYQ